MDLSFLLTRELSVPASNHRSLSVLSSRDYSSTAESPAISPLPSQSEGTVPNDSDPWEWPARKERKCWVWLPVNEKDIWHEKINSWKCHCAWGCSRAGLSWVQAWARAGTAHGILDSRLEPSPDLESSWLELARATKKPPRTNKRLESRVRVSSWTPVQAGSSRQGARVSSSTPVWAAKSWMPRDLSRLGLSPELGSSLLGSCTTLIVPGVGKYSLLYKKAVD